MKYLKHSHNGALNEARESILDNQETGIHVGSPRLVFFEEIKHQNHQVTRWMLESLGSSLELLGWWWGSAVLWDFLQQEASHGNQEASNGSLEEVLVLGTGNVPILGLTLKLHGCLWRDGVPGLCLGTTSAPGSMKKNKPVRNF